MGGGGCFFSSIKVPWLTRRDNPSDFSASGAALIKSQKDISTTSTALKHVSDKFHILFQIKPPNTLWYFPPLLITMKTFINNTQTGALKNCLSFFFYINTISHWRKGIWDIRQRCTRVWTGCEKLLREWICSSCSHGCVWETDIPLLCFPLSPSVFQFGCSRRRRPSLLPFHKLI